MAGFRVENNAGRLTFGNGYVIPNPAVILRDQHTLDLWFPQYEGTDVETVSGIVRYPRVAKQAKGILPLLVSETASSAGVAATNRVQQLKRNIDELVDVAAQSLNTTTPTQTITYVPWTGGPTKTLTGALVLPPEIGQRVPGVGVNVALQVFLSAVVTES